MGSMWSRDGETSSIFGTDESVPYFEGLASWSDAANTIADFFGWTVYGFGDGYISFYIVTYTDRDGKDYHSSSWKIPESACVKMIEKINPSYDDCAGCGQEVTCGSCPCIKCGTY